MSTLSKLSIEVNMGRNIRLEMCHGEDLSKVVLVDVTSGQELFSDSEDGDRVNKDDRAKLGVKIAPGNSALYLGLESFDSEGQWECEKEEDNEEGISVLESDMLGKREEVSKMQDEVLSFKSMEGRKLQDEEAVLEDRILSRSNLVVQKTNKAGKKERVKEDIRQSFVLNDKKVFLVSPASSPVEDLKFCQVPFDFLADVRDKLNLQSLEEDDKLGSYVNKAQGGSASKQGKSRKTPAKAGSSRQAMVPSVVSARGGGVRRQNMLSPVKKGKFVSSGSAGSVSNVYCIRIKNNHFLVVFSEDGMRQMNYRFPGTQRKAWCTAFERDLRNETAWSSGEMCPILAIVKRRDIREPRDVYLAQRANPSFHMSAYLCPIDVDDTAVGISNQIVAKLNEYAADSRNNMRMFRFVKDITEDVAESDLHALDYWLLTRDIVTAVGSLYEDEIDNETFYEFEGLVDGLFERVENTDDVRETMARFM